MFEVWRNHTHYQTVDRIDTPSKTKRPVCITKNGLQKRWMKTAFYSFEQNQRHYSCLVCKLARPLICCRWSMAPPYLSIVKSRYSYFVPEVQARLKDVSIIFYWERGYIKRPAVSIEVSAKVEELLLDERHDRKPRRPARKYETRNVDLSEDILGCPSCCQKRRCRWVDPNSYTMFSL